MIYPAGTLLNFILQNAPVRMVQECIRNFNVRSLGYKLKQQIINEHPLYRYRSLDFGIELSQDFKEFEVDWLFLIKANKDIDKCRRLLKLFGKYHPRYIELAQQHDALVVANNKLNEPLNRFLALYKKAQNDKGGKIRVVNKRERIKIPKIKAA